MADERDTRNQKIAQENKVSSYPVIETPVAGTVEGEDHPQRNEESQQPDERNERS
jgi:hypothetical protein